MCAQTRVVMNKFWYLFYTINPLKLRSHWLLNFCSIEHAIYAGGGPLGIAPICTMIANISGCPRSSTILPFSNR